ncbi:glucose/sorbosone dehydrogenase [Alcanivorax sp. S71-1-4]|uniref:hypothetical protein n=1 Tax=Alcanivorax sp. S71-1-4 TaxID=1177159 RepID=UPI00135CD35A|nr:hypothetical protein [Alcanivorax sp. S71-1-4]KAF0806414.1 glucose/sorbosone dehydrogenase [Alcanivorax sp. S71-1-4]
MTQTAGTGARLGRGVVAFVLAVLVAVVLGAVIQTQYNLAALIQLGAEIPLSVRLRTTGEDLIGFSPVYAVLVVLALAFSLPVAALVSRGLPPARGLVYALAALAGLIVAVLVVNHLAPMPTLIAATRVWHGLLLMALGAAVAGWLFARLMPR